MDYAIQSAIEESIRQQTTPTLTVRIDTQEWVNAVNGLEAAADDYVRITSGDNRIGGEVVEVREFAGTDDDGDEWHVHVHATA